MTEQIELRRLALRLLVFLLLFGTVIYLAIGDPPTNQAVTLLRIVILIVVALTIINLQFVIEGVERE